MIFARLSTLCNSLALSADRCALQLEKMHFVSLESLNPRPLVPSGIKRLSENTSSMVEKRFEQMQTHH